MADDNTSRSYRSNDPYRRGTQGSGEPADPLAELARLIGQPDPFPGSGRSHRRPDAYEERGEASDWRRTAAAMPAYETYPEESQEEAPQRYRDEPPGRRQSRRPEPYFAAAEPPYTRREPYQMAAAVDEHVDDSQYEEPGYGREQQFDDTEEFRQDDRQYADDRRYPAPAREQRMQEPYFDLGTPVSPQDDEMYDDPPRARRRGGLITAVTLIGCAMVGTAGAYGYRTYYAAPNGRIPPVITAETTPSKVVSGDVQSGKAIQDRVGDPVSGERLVSREEQPVTLSPGSGAPRVVLPAPSAQSQSGFPPPPTAGTSSGGGEAKRIRTVTIRPEGADPAGRPVAGAQANPTPPPRPPAKSATAGRNTAPLPLDPEAQPESPPAPSARERSAAVAPSTTQSLQPPAPRAPAAPANASAASSGGYLVQVSSQRSEAEAQASYRALQTKYPDQLDGQSVVVRRVDLGDKGVYYRALVGPFASSAEAVQFCTDFKAAGGQCLIPRN